MLPRHCRKTASDCGLGAEVDGLIEELVGATPRVVGEINALLPPGSPSAVAEPILAGIASAAEHLEQHR